MKKVLIFANPISGRGRGRYVAEQIAGRLLRDGLGVRMFFSPVESIDAAAFDPDCRAAVVVGGDGTLRAVAGRLYRLLGGRTPPLLVVPMGTANLMGQHLGLARRDRRTPDRVAATIRGGRVVRMDAATANGQMLLLIASVGLDAHVVHSLTRARRGPIRHLSYVLPTLGALARYDYPPLTVEVDGRRVFSDAPAMAFVGNVREYGTGFPMLPHARSDDGLLDVCVLPCRSRAEVMRLVIDAAAGQHVHGEEVVYVRGKRVRIESPLPAPVQVDGEAAGRTPVEIEMLPDRLPFLLPDVDKE